MILQVRCISHQGVRVSLSAGSSKCAAHARLGGQEMNFGLGTGLRTYRLSPLACARRRGPAEIYTFDR
jgi:hypothetical protein